MNLKLLRVERIVLNVFGKEDGEIMNVGVVKFKIKTVTDNLFMEASLGEKCPYSEFFWSVFRLIWTE